MKKSSQQEKFKALMILNPRHPLKDDLALATCYQFVIDAREEISRGLAEPAGKGLMPENVVNYSKYLFLIPLVCANYQLLK